MSILRYGWLRRGSWQSRWVRWGLSGAPEAGGDGKKKAPPGEDGADVRKEFCGEAVCLGD